MNSLFLKPICALHCELIEGEDRIRNLVAPLVLFYEKKLRFYIRN